MVGGGGIGVGGGTEVAVGGGESVRAYSIYSSCWVALRRTLAAQRGALTSKAFLWRQMAKAMMATPARMPMTTKNLNSVAGWYPNCSMVLTTCCTGAD